MEKGKPQTNPPEGLKPEQVPQFVVVGTDDNATAGLDNGTGLGFLLNLFQGKNNPAGNGNSGTFDGSPIHFSMYGMSEYLWNGAVSPPADVKKAWRIAFEQGHELGTHTETHPRGRNSTLEQWDREISACEERIRKPYIEAELAAEGTGVGLVQQDLIGFRAPYLEYNNNLFKVLRQKKYKYDCSIEEGYQGGQDGSNHRWPYLLDNGCPTDTSIEPCEGLWEIPVYPFIVPDDEDCGRWELEPSLRELFLEREQAREVLANGAYGHANHGLVRGMDYDMWETYGMTRRQGSAVLKNTLLNHLHGNRAPMTLCFHSDLYQENTWADIENANAEGRMGAIEDFIEFALLQEDARIVSAAELLCWLENPTPL